MNWKKGFRRAALIWAILAAIAGVMVALRIVNTQVVQEAQQVLQSAEQSQIKPFGLVKEWPKHVIRSNEIPWQEWADGEVLVNDTRWENWTDEELLIRAQKIQWERWTYEELQTTEEPNMPVGENTLTTHQEKKFLKIFERLSVSVKAQHKHLSAEQALALLIDITLGKFDLIKTDDQAFEVFSCYYELERIAEPAWRELGWKQAKGGRLPYSPIKVSYMIRARRVKLARNFLKETRLRYVPAGAIAGGVVGFGIVWLVYLILEQVVSWLARGFHGVITEQKSGDTDEQATKRYGSRRIATVSGIVAGVICAILSITTMLAQRYGSLAEFEIWRYHDSRLGTLSMWGLVGLCTLVGILSGACGFLVVYGFVKWVVLRFYSDTEKEITKS